MMCNNLLVLAQTLLLLASCSNAFVVTFPYRSLSFARPLPLQARVESKDSLDLIPVTFVDANTPVPLECFRHAVSNIDGVEYTVGIPMNQCIAVCQFNSQKGAYDVIPVESPQMDHVFGLAAHEMSEIFGETYGLQRSPQVLTCSGNFEDMDDEEEEDDDDDVDEDGGRMDDLVDVDEDYEIDEDEDDSEEELDQVDSSDDWEVAPDDEMDDSPPATIQGSSLLSPRVSDVDQDEPTDDAFPFDDLDPLFSFECEKDRFVVARILTPIFVVGRKDPEIPEVHRLLSPEEGARVIPILQERLGDDADEE